MECGGVAVLFVKIGDPHPNGTKREESAINPDWEIVSEVLKHRSTNEGEFDKLSLEA